MQYHLIISRSGPHGYVVELNGSFLEVDARPLRDGGKLISFSGIVLKRESKISMCLRIIQTVLIFKSKVSTCLRIIQNCTDFLNRVYVQYKTVLIFFPLLLLSLINKM